MAKSRSLTLGMEIVPDLPVSGLIQHAKEAEKSGFSHVWVADHYLNRDAFTLLTAIALNTSRILLGPGVANPYTRSPLTIASTAATLNEISGGRCVIGLGAGDRMTMSNMGYRWTRPVRRLEEAVTIIRTVTRGEKTNFRGRFFRIRNAQLNYKPYPIPIYIGAQGPLMLETAGRIGDGVLINASHPADISFSTRHISKGAKKTGRRLENLDVAAYVAFSVDEEHIRAIKAAKAVVAFIVGSAGEDLLQRHGISSDIVRRVNKYLRKGNYEAAAHEVPPRLVEELAIVGTPQTCIEKLRHLVTLGVRHVVIGAPWGKDKNAALKLMLKTVIPAFHRREA